MKTLSILASLVLCLACLSCNESPKIRKQSATPEAAVPEFLRSNGSLIEIPDFEIEVAHSAASIEKLNDQGESVIVSANFSGEPSNPKDGDEIGELQLAKKDIELAPSERIARFSGLSFPKAYYDKLADKDFMLLINVVSGRKSSEDNLLNCGIVQLNVSKIGGQRFKVDCALIEESF